ncbi:DNA methylase [Candidatus Woesearchaeota archaeon CG08_land_8_20_14_0_20_47_9]|nr:MAG: hypothetical protein AUJ69_01535 [Candidatus Woesearchaeota archaeon CG1_02_47_18]PIN74984.1 MAG: DNA methylase [Candidatus Woesearchaeota archaeon CG10_big_fil_rev_8_21_14_0_10_47_5]PIO04463.1 MAG: DNA methylase [Candidatus Woesearchaeota archaeon CG08_land_8_20_14_0_20_47_9]HII30331.1 methyltransferase [Candidatus Woesearchaeota archaeon]
MQLTKSSLAIELSKLRLLRKPRPELEQYPTSSELAAQLLWMAYMKGDVAGRVVADLGCGSGILGIGAMLLGAKKVYFVDVDEEALKATEQNIGLVKGVMPKRACFKLLKADISKIKTEDSRVITGSADCVIQNPPFGIQKKHADQPFLKAAFSIANVIYSIHSRASIDFVKRFAAEHSFKVVECLDERIELPKSMSFHTRRMYRADVVICYFRKP